MLMRHGHKSAMTMSAAFMILRGQDAPIVRLYFDGKDGQGNKCILVDGIESERLVTWMCTPQK